jgi:uncharacterized protein
MRFIPRKLADVLQDANRHFPAVVVTGPRRTGKTTLLRELFPRAQYVLLEDPDIPARVRSDPRHSSKKCTHPRFSTRYRTLQNC